MCPLAVELHIQTIFREVVIATKLVAAAGKDGAVFTIGVGRAVDAPADRAVLGSERHHLISRVAGGWRVDLTPQMTGVLEQEGRATPLTEITRQAGLRFMPPVGARLRIDCGATTFVVEESQAAPVLPRSRLRVVAHFAPMAVILLGALGALFLLAEHRRTPPPRFVDVPGFSWTLRLSRAELRELQACEERRELQDLCGRLNVGLAIDGDGTVLAAGQVDSLGHPDVEACVLEAVRHWRFRPPGTRVVLAHQFPLTADCDRVLASDQPARGRR